MLPLKPATATCTLFNMEELKQANCEVQCFYKRSPLRMEIRINNHKLNGEGKNDCYPTLGLVKKNWLGPWASCQPCFNG